MTLQQYIKQREKEFDDIITEVVERIVIDYANLSGRETANRAEFRERTRKHLSKTIRGMVEKLCKLAKPYYFTRKSDKETMAVPLKEIQQILEELK